MANVNTRTQAIVLGNPEPANVATGAVPLLPTQILEVGNTGIINCDRVAPTTASKAAQVAPAFVFPTVDPMVKNAWWNNSGTLTISAQNT